jgi:hypothetical protein
MATTPSEKRKIDLQLIYNDVQLGTLVIEPMRFNLQNTKGNVHPGTVGSGDARQLGLVFKIKGGDETILPVFTGALAHGPLAARAPST